MLISWVKRNYRPTDQNDNPFLQVYPQMTSSIYKKQFYLTQNFLDYEFLKSVSEIHNL